MRVSHVTFKIFSNNFKSLLVFWQISKKLPLDFLISFRIIKDFQESINLTLIFVKIDFLNKNSLRIHENF